MPLSLLTNLPSFSKSNHTNVLSLLLLVYFEKTFYVQRPLEHLQKQNWRPAEQLKKRTKKLFILCTQQQKRQKVIDFDVMRLRRRFVSVAVVCFFVVVDVSLADPETVDGLLKKRSEPVLAVQEPVARALSEKLLTSNKFQPGARIHFTNGFRQDSLGRNFHHGYQNQNGKMRRN